jgi:galactose mutarotase-like enzyme
VLSVSNEHVEFVVAPEHGMTVTELRLRTDGRNILWQRPDRAAPGDRPGVGPPGEPSRRTFADLFAGGWFELSPHAGFPGIVDGRATTMHGEAVRLAWEVASEGSDHVEAVARCVRYPLELRRRIELVGSTVTFTSSVVNVGRRACSITHGEHPCLDGVLFARGSIGLTAKTARVLDPVRPDAATLEPGPFEWPIARDLAGRSVDVSAIPAVDSLGHDHIELELAADDVVVSTRDGLRATIQVEREAHPYVLVWRSSRPGPASRAWNVFAVEPQSSSGRGIDDAVRNGDVRVLAPDARADFSCRMSLSMRDVSRAGAVLRAEDGE